MRMNGRRGLEAPGRHGAPRLSGNSSDRPEGTKIYTGGLARQEMKPEEYNLLTKETDEYVKRQAKLETFAKTIRATRPGTCGTIGSSIARSSRPRDRARSRSTSWSSSMGPPRSTSPDPTKTRSSRNPRRSRTCGPMLKEAAALEERVASSESHKKFTKAATNGWARLPRAETCSMFPSRGSSETPCSPTIESGSWDWTPWPLTRNSH